jgi:hypothetical protein
LPTLGMLVAPFKTPAGEMLTTSTASLMNVAFEV